MAEDMDVGAPPPEESGNRMFLIGAIILGGIFVVALISIFVLYFLTRGSQQAAPGPQDQTATMAIQLGATQTGAVQGTQTRVALALQTAAITYTPTQTQTAIKLSTSTFTPVVFPTVAPPTSTGTVTPPAGLQAVTYTKTATRGTATATRVGAATALPQTGFGDSGGFPALLLLGGGCLLVIFLARQIRLGRAPR